MMYILLSLLMFCVSVSVHVLYCRRQSKQQLHTKAYCAIAVALMGVYLSVAFYVKRSLLFSDDSLLGVSLEWTGLAILIVLVPVYLCFYVLTQLTSPSKRIIEAIVKGTEITYDDIRKNIAAEDFIGTRLRDLKISGCITEITEVYTVTASGRLIARVLNIMQKFLGREAGG